MSKSDNNISRTGRHHETWPIRRLNTHTRVYIYMCVYVCICVSTYIHTHTLTVKNLIHTHTHIRFGCPQLAVWLWASYLTSLCLSSSIFKMKGLNFATLWIQITKTTHWWNKHSKSEVTNQKPTRNVSTYLKISKYGNSDVLKQWKKRAYSVTNTGQLVNY